jgi:hypothetical protein
MKKKNNRQKQRKRYYDYRLVLLFVCLFAVFFALSYLRNRLLHTPLLVGWKAFWDAPQSTLTSLNYCLVFFEVLLTWAAAGVLCADDKAVGDVDKDYSSALWTSALTGLPLGINCVSDLSVWAYYSVFMLVTAWLIGKEIGFAYPVGNRMLKSVYNETADMNVRTKMGAEYRFRHHSGFWISCIALSILFILSVVFFIKAYHQV